MGIENFSEKDIQRLNFHNFFQVFSRQGGFRLLGSHNSFKTRFRVTELPTPLFKLKDFQR